MIAKIFLISGILSAGLIFALRVAGLIDNDIASDTIGRILGVIAVLGITSGAIGLVVGGRKGSRNPPGPTNSGPQF